MFYFSENLEFVSVKIRSTIRTILGTAIIIFLCAASASCEESQAVPDYGQATFGVRMGEATGEGFLDLLIPAVRTENGVFFVNPRAALKDAGANELNLGLGYRHLIGDDLAVAGANIYYDSRESVHGNRFDQFGAGLEILGKWMDFRFNYYDADNSPQLYNEYATTETATATSTEVLNRTTTTTSFSDPFASGYSIWVDQQITSTFQQTTRLTTRTVETTRIFREYEAGMDGYDGELGFLIPLPEAMPECRIFGGYYSYDNDFGPDIRGVKGRMEIRTGPYLTLDGEVFEDEELNGTNYFVGFRLQIPLKGSYTWDEIKKGLTHSAHPDLRRRMYSDMVMRDVRVQKEESGPVEDRDRFRRTETVVSKAVNSKTEQKTSSKRLEVASDITFVDGDSQGEQDGTAEYPYQTISQGVNHADGHSTVFVTGMEERPYDEHVTLQSGQTLTSEIILPRGLGSYSSGTVPLLQPSAGSGPVVTMADNTTVQRMHIIADYGPGIYAPSGAADRTITIRDSIISSTGFNDAVWIENQARGSEVLISHNTISTRQDWTFGVFINNEESWSPRVTLEDNIITTRGNSGHGMVIDNAFTVNGEVSARDNTVTTWGETADGIHMDSWYAIGNSFEATGNFLTAEGDGPFGSGISTFSTGAIDGIINDTSYDNTFGCVFTTSSIVLPGTSQVFVDPGAD